jgi:hypothetical protein
VRCWPPVRRKSAAVVACLAFEQRRLKYVGKARVMQAGSEGMANCLGLHVHEKCMDRAVLMLRKKVKNKTSLQKISS